MVILCVDIWRTQQFCPQDGTPAFLPRETKVKTHPGPEVSVAGGGGQGQDAPVGIRMSPQHPSRGAAGLSAQGWSVSISLSPRWRPQATTLAEAGDPEEVSTTVLSLGEPLLIWTGPLPPGPAAPGCAGGGRWVMQGGGWGSRHIQALSAFPPPQVLGVPVPLVKAGNPQAC